MAASWRGGTRIAESECRRQQLEAYLSRKGKLKIPNPNARYYLGDKTNREIQPPTAPFKVGLGGELKGGGPTKAPRLKDTKKPAPTNHVKSVAARSRAQPNTKTTETKKTLAKTVPTFPQTRVADIRIKALFPVESNTTENESITGQTAQFGQYEGDIKPATSAYANNLHRLGDQEKENQRMVGTAPNAGHSVSTALIKPFTEQATITQVGTSKDTGSDNRIWAIGIHRTATAAPGAAKAAGAFRAAPGAAKAAGTFRAAPGAAKAAGTFRAAPGAAKAAGTFRAAPGAAKAAGTFRAAPGAAKAAGTFRAAPGAAKAAGTVRAAPGAAKAAGTVRAAPGAAKAAGTVRAAPGAAKAAGTVRAAPGAAKAAGTVRAAPGAAKAAGTVRAAPGAAKAAGTVRAAPGAANAAGTVWEAPGAANTAGRVMVPKQSTKTESVKNYGYRRLSKSTKQLASAKSNPGAGLHPQSASIQNGTTSTGSRPMSIWKPFTRSAQRMHPALGSSARKIKESKRIIQSGSKSTASAKSNAQHLGDHSSVTKTLKGKDERRKQLNEWLASRGKTYKRPPMPTPLKSAVKSVKKNLEHSFWEAIEEEEQNSLADQVNHMLDDCMKLQEKGLPSEQVSAALQNVPEGNKFAKYWICRARLLESAGTMDAVVALFEQAVHNGAEPVEELRSALVETIMRNANSQTACTEKEDNATDYFGESDAVTHLTTTMRILCDKMGGHGSSVVKYRVTATPQVLRGKEAVSRIRSVGRQDLKFLTPVRRSVRIEHVSAAHPEMLREHDCCVSSLNELLAVEEAETFVYRENQALLGE
uniref:uncharacterized protein n=1 Tax=Pristiophorus japonicus TaxID=55135 RepID=UPI00398EBDB7